MENSTHRRLFGHWDPPGSDDATRIEVPLHLTCRHCEEPFQVTDAGAIDSAGEAHHKECSLRHEVGGIGLFVDPGKYREGHLGPDAGLTYRESARLVWRLKVEKWDVTENDLNALRATVDLDGTIYDDRKNNP